jgi:hypothetical protein
VREFIDILLNQRATGFPGFTGTHVAAFVPISANLLNDLIAQALPPGAAVSDVQIDPQPGNVLRVRLRIARAPLIPPLTITLLIERQPEFPESPVLVLRLASSGLTVLARAASRLFEALPPGLRIENDLVLVDIAELLRQRGAIEWLQYVRELEITTAPGAVLVSVRSSITGPQSSPPPRPA